MKKTLFALFFLLVCSLSAFAQQMQITGVVTGDFDESALPGVRVYIKGGKTGTLTDIDGKYSIQASQGDVLVFSYVGSTTQERKVASQNVINVVLRSATELDDVVVIGYGTARKSDLTGAVGSLKMDDVMKATPTNISQGLQGRLAGVEVYQNDGAPGSAVRIQIRGANSFSTDTEPLYVVDNVPFDGGGSAGGGNGRSTNALSFINPHDIESVEVLKDASATAIYGSRGANGVVLITTKKGKEGADKINVSANFFTSRFVRSLEYLEGGDFANYQNEMIRNGAIYNGVGWYELPYRGEWGYDKEYNISTYNPSPEDFRRGYMNGGTDWLSGILQNSFSQEYNVSFSGGDQKGSYFVSAGLMDQQGTLVGSSYNRATARMNIDRQLRSFLKVGASLNYTTSITNFTDNNKSDDPRTAGAYVAALLYPPTVQPNDPRTMELNSDLIGTVGANPVGSVSGLTDEDKRHTIHASTYAEIKLMESLRFTQRLGYGYNYSHRNYYEDRTTYSGYYQEGIGSQTDYWNSNIAVESMLTYDKQINVDHRLNAVAAVTFEQYDWGAKGMWNREFPDDITKMYSMGDGLFDGRSMSSSRGTGRLASLLGRANYVFKDRYYVTASGRHDGSSKFAEGNKWADFFSFALAWRASEEEFVKNLNVFSNLKLRLSYGETGNQGISNYETLEKMGLRNTAINGSIIPGYVLSSNGPVNKNLKWETTKQYNAGIDMGFADNRFNITIDAYYKRTEDLLQQVVIPPSSGYSSMRTNFGHVINKGLEFTVGARILDKTPLKWDVNANIYTNRNEIGGLYGDQFAADLYAGMGQIYIQRNGHPIGSVYGYVEDGFFDNIAEVRAYPEYANKDEVYLLSRIGEIKYKNLDDDPSSISNTDRTIIGDVTPDFSFGITNNFSYRNWNLSFFIQGTVGNDMVNLNLRDVSMVLNRNIPKFAYEERWYPGNEASARFPKPYDGWDRSMKFSDRNIEDGSYVRLKNVNLGYTFLKPTKFISTMNLYVSATNLITLTKYSWFDPDVNAMGNASQKGVDAHSYPSSSVFSAGVNIGF